MERADPKRAKRERIASQMEEFLSRGNSITKVPEGKRVIPEFAHKLAYIDGESVAERNKRYKSFKSKRSSR